MKKLFIIILCVIAVILLTGIAGLLKALLWPPEVQIPEFAEVLPSAQTAPGTEVKYHLPVMLPADCRIKSVTLYKQGKETSAGEFKFDRWKFDRLQWSADGVFPVLDIGKIENLSIKITAEKFFSRELIEFTIPLPVLHSTVPDSVKPGEELSLAPIPEAGEIDGDTAAAGKPFYKNWLFYLIIALAIMLIIIVIWLKKHRHEALSLPLDQKTLREIRQICDMVKDKQITPENGFARLSDVVRNYLESRSGLPASRRTTEEFLKELSAMIDLFSTEERVYLTGFLNHADLIKFAGVNAGEDMLNNAAAQAGELVRATTRAAEEKETGK